MYGLQGAEKMQAANYPSSQPIHPMDTMVGQVSIGGVVKAIETLENELQVQRNLINSLCQRLENYIDKADMNAPTGVQPARAHLCAFEQRINMSVDNVESTNALLRTLLDRVQL